MKRLFLAVLALSLGIAANAADSTKVKTGWSFGAVPAVGYSSDLGVQYGVTGDIYYFGDGSTYPVYKHKISAQLSRYTKGSGIAHLFYDSKYLIPGIRVSAGATYINNPLYSFYGFNGGMQAYDSSLGAHYYAYHRKMFRLLADFQGKIVGDLYWAAGFTFWSIGASRIADKYNFEGETLYDKYVNNSVIYSNEASGGKSLELKAGLVYDTRDYEPYPTTGWWADVCLYGSPDISSNGHAYLKYAAHVRKYISVVPEKLVFAGHIAYQGTLAGSAPWYVQQNISTMYLKQIYNEGLGSSNSVRGMLNTRMIGNDYFWTNLEFRFKFAKFNLFKQEFYLSTNPFFDMGCITRSYRSSELKALLGNSVAEDHSLHCSAGIGLKVVMNQNFIFGPEYGKPFKKDDGPGALNFIMNYIF